MDIRSLGVGIAIGVVVGMLVMALAAGPAVAASAALGLVILAGVILAWSAIGFIVAAIRFFITPPPPPPPGAPCATCFQLQELWASMSWLEKVASFANFAAAALICQATG